MKKFFKTKFKKIISIFTAIVVLTLVLIIPVSAAEQNLFSGSFQHGSFSSSSGVFEGGVNNRIATVNPISLSLGNYKLSVPEGCNIFYFIYDSSGNFISSESSSSWSQGNFVEFSINHSFKLNISIRKSDNSIIYPSDFSSSNVLLLPANFKVNYLNNVVMVNLSYDELFESSKFNSHSDIPLIWYSPELVDKKFHFKDGRFILDFTSSFNEVINNGSYHCSFPFLFKPNGSDSITGTLNNVNYTVKFDDSLSYSGTTSFSKSAYVGGSYVANLDFDINVSAPSNNLFSDFSIIFDFYNASDNAQSFIYWFGFSSSPMIIYNNTYPSYSSPEVDSGISEENKLSEAADEVGLSAWDTMNSFLDRNFHIFTKSATPLSYAIDYFLDSNMYVYFILLFAIFIGVLPLIGRYIGRGS